MALQLLKKLFCSSKPKETLEMPIIEHYAKERSLIFLPNRTLYHLNKSIQAKSILLDAHYGLYIIESAQWHYKNIKNAKAILASHKKRQKADINIDTLHNFITQKFNEVLHQEVCPIINILYLPNITKEQFETLDESFHSLLPSKRLIFSDSSLDEICQHLHQDIARLERPLNTFKVQSALFVDSTIIDSNAVFQANAEQSAFIQSELGPLSSLSGTYSTGKSVTLLLKMIKEKLKDPALPITLIVPTQFAADTMRSKLLELSEYAIVDIAFEGIDVITTASVGAKLKRKGIVFCDDAHLFSKAFIQKILKNAKHYTLCFVGVDIPKEQQHFELKHIYQTPPSITYERVISQKPSSSIEYLYGNIYMNVMLVINQLLSKDSKEEILIVVDNNHIAQEIQENINDYYGNIVSKIDTTLSVTYIKRNQLEIVHVNELSMFTCNYVIATIEKMENRLYVNQAISRCTKRLYLLQESQ